jgi:branched-subunit amino acid transport protein
MIDKTTLWIVIVLLGIGTFGLRFVFTGLVGDREMPSWLLRHLRYTVVAVLPALVAPMVVWPSATGGELDAPRLAAAITAAGLGYATKNVLVAMLSGAVVLYLGLFLVG